MQCSREQQAQINLKFISVYLSGTVKCNFAKLGFPQQQIIKNLLFHDHCSANRVVISTNVLRMLYSLDVETEQTAHQKKTFVMFANTIYKFNFITVQRLILRL